MQELSYDELVLKLKKVMEENDKLKEENSKLQAKIIEMQFMIKKYIMDN